MQKFLFASLFTFLVSVLSAQESGETIWEGKLNVGAELRLAFHFNKQTDNTFKGTMDSPDQGVKGIQLSSVVFTNDSLKTEIKLINGGFYGKRINDTVIEGVWKQASMELPMQLKKVKKLTTLNRPQTPKPPFNYNSEEVEYDNADKTVHLGATLTYPKNGSAFTTIVLITGSGQQDRDETIFEHRPFAVIADYLTKLGFAVLRVDDRGMGKSTGRLQHATTADFAKDVETSLVYLSTRKEINKQKIGLLGHSEGGAIAEIVAANPSNNIAFVISLAGPGTKGAELMAEQNEAILTNLHVSKQSATAYKNLYRKLADIAIQEKDTTNSIPQAIACFYNWKKQQTPAIISELNMQSDSVNQLSIKELIVAFSQDWMNYFIAFDPQPYLQKFSCKVLALNGSKDIQVLPTSNINGIKKSLTKSKSPLVETKEFPGLNHLFQHCIKCSTDEYVAIEETISPEVLETIGNWLKKNIQ